MYRLTVALVFALIGASPVVAQPPTPNYESQSPQVSYGSHLPIVKSGGHIFGRDGIYPYDSGEYLLGGTGFTRFRGGYTMEMPSTAGPVLATGKHRFHSRPGLLHR